MATMELKSEVTGAVWKIMMQAGDAVAEGDTVMVMESMKMEIPVIAQDAGTLKELYVYEGEPVTEGQAIAILET